jgi:hypothetical protein
MLIIDPLMSLFIVLSGLDINMVVWMVIHDSLHPQL